MTSTMRFDKWENPTATKSVTMDQISGGSALVPITPTGVVVSSGTGSVDSSGLVTFSGALTMGINGAFTSEFRQYRVVMTVAAVSTQDIFFKFRGSGADQTGGYYGVTAYTAFGSAISNWSQGNNATNAFLFRTSEREATCVLEITPRRGNAESKVLLDAWNIQQAANFFGGYNNALADCDGFSLISTGQNMTGLMKIYGYR